MRVTGHWWSEGRRMRVQVLDVKKFERREVRDKFREMIAREWTRVKENESVSPEEEWSVFKSIVWEVAGEVCGFRYVGRKGKRIEWWDEEMRLLVREKRRLHEVCLQNNSVSDRERYREKNREVKRKV